MLIRKLKKDERPPMTLLLLADPSRSLIEDYIKSGECFLAEAAGQVIGVYVLLSTKPKTVELVNLAVDEHFQGKGLGKHLVNDAIRVAKAMGYRRFEVATGNSSLGPLALYQKCGFRIIEVEHDYFVKHYSEVIIENGMRCMDRVWLSLEL
ncbi:N-acetyltransferase [Pullulanibacillus camelliae]|uniref:N-acetyltransferase n=1 Tax=Pullulanibacillus camelliae TaxID=1707096 RepID=A0A8J2VPQ1_9BACL|nr:GNAT family N-acetyltransferase [Pullulanibacillus camelliae]GGE34866.1 N-acetyltransferase [Pullulanibacillus camelliae]